MIKNLGLQLYTLREFMKDEKSIDESFARIAEIGYTEAQTAGNTIPAETFAALAKKHGIDIDKRKITLAEPIKSFGEFKADVKLYSEVSGKINVLVTSKKQ